MAQGIVLSAGALTVIILGSVAVLFAFSTWLYKNFVKKRDRQPDDEDYRKAEQSSMTDSTTLLGYRSGGQTKWAVASTNATFNDSKPTSRRESSTSTLHTPDLDTMNRHLFSPDQSPAPSPSGDLGSLAFVIRYNQTERELKVFIDRGEDLWIRDMLANMSDIYVILQILPERRHRVKTKIKKKTNSPVFQEEFIFPDMTLNQIKANSLHFVVLTYDRFSRNEVIGEVVCPLTDLDLNMEPEVCLSKPLAQRRLQTDNDTQSDILVSLCYYPDTNQISVGVMKARNLPRRVGSGTAGDPFVKVYLRFNKHRVAKRKTKTKVQTLRPVFNESFSMELPHVELETIPRSTSLEIIVANGDKEFPEERIGRVDIGVDHGDFAKRYWLDVFRHPGKQIADWHTLHMYGDYI